MLGIQINNRSKKTVKTQPVTEVQQTVVIIEEGDSVLHFDGRRGVLRKIAVSPYFLEERANILRGYVEFNDGSADWCLAEDLGLVAKATALTTIAR